jgi:hypothetical protein
MQLRWRSVESVAEIEVAHAAAAVTVEAEATGAAVEAAVRFPAVSEVADNVVVANVIAVSQLAASLADAISAAFRRDVPHKHFEASQIKDARKEFHSVPSTVDRTTKCPNASVQKRETNSIGNSAGARGSRTSTAAEIVN